MEANQAYETNQDLARQLWIKLSNIVPCYIQWCGGAIWRISNVQGSIVGYADLESQSLQGYGQGKLQEVAA